MAAKVLDELVAVISSGLGDPNRATLTERAKQALIQLFGERYNQRSRFAVRANFGSGDNNVPFAGLLHEDSATSGPYGGMSLVWFPVAGDGEDPPASLLTFVCGTRGLDPDEQIL